MTGCRSIHSELPNTYKYGEKSFHGLLTASHRAVAGPAKVTLTTVHSVAAHLHEFRQLK